MNGISTNTLSGLQLRALRQVILDAFEPNDFVRLLSDHLGKKFRNFVSEGSFENQVFELLNAFRGRGFAGQNYASGDAVD